MATTKNIKIQQNKILTYTINKPGFKTITRSIKVAQDRNINVTLINNNNVTEPYQLGDRLFGISSFVDYFTPSGDYDVDSLKYITAKQTTGNSLEDIQVIKGTSNTVGETNTWLSKVEKDLQITTARGSSNTFIFTYNGSTWDLTGATTQSAQDISTYGISFEGTPTSGDVITVTETQYNRFAVFVLDSNYRGNYKWSTVSQLIMPIQYDSNSNPQINCIESATYFNNIVFNNGNLSNYPIFNQAKNLGDFILPNSIILNALVPTMKEVYMLWNNRVALDSFDPIIQGGSTAFNLTNWNLAHMSDNYDYCASCIEQATNGFFAVRHKTNSTDGVYNNINTKNYSLSLVPIFEVPVM